jgi:pyruvate/2-oxoacid:ferredoxin oxidoreductase alpha subunit
MKKVIMGNHAVSYGAMLSRVEVIAAYPITPQTQVVEELSEMCASGKLKAKFLKVESEHSAMASCIGVSATGARAFTATSAQGLALMHELLHWAAGARLPIVMANINRAMAPGWSIWTDQNDSLAQRDTGWLQFYCESNQEVMDTIIQAYKISEKVLLPSMVILDAFVLSHTSEPVDIPDVKEVDRFLPPYKPKYKLDINDPHAFGCLSAPDTYMEFRYKMQKAMEEAVEVAEQADAEFREQFGRSYGLVEEYRTDDAELILVTSSTVTSTTRVAVDELRDKGKKVGMLKIRLFRPFPKEKVISALSKAEKVAVIDRNISYGHGGIFAEEIKSIIYTTKNERKPKLFDYIAGIGGRDITPELIINIAENTLKASQPESDIIWMGVKL